MNYGDWMLIAVFLTVIVMVVGWYIKIGGHEKSDD